VESSISLIQNQGCVYLGNDLIE